MVAKYFFLFTCIQMSVSSPPNIVILLADDMGWNDVGFHGAEIPTPNLDALAYSGIVFKRMYVNPTCTPSRASLLTGKYPIRYGLQAEPIMSQFLENLPTNLTTMPQVMKKLGYRTHLVGKWHLGYSTLNHFPTKRGFDSFFGFLNGYLSYYDGVHYDPPNVGLDFRSNEDESWTSAYAKYLPEILSNRAEEIIRNHGRNNSGEPLFLLVASNVPHWGNNRPWLQEHPPKRNNDTDFISIPERRVSADVLRYLDDTMGNLTTTLKEEGMLDNTIVIFMSDNGGNSNPLLVSSYCGSSNHPLRGAKDSMYDGGVRVPAIMWKSGLNSSQPKIYKNLFHMTDWLPTLNSAAGGATLEGLDGIDQWSALMGETSTVPRKELLVDIHDRRDSFGYIMDNYKLVKSFDKNFKWTSTDYHFSPPIQPNPDGYQIAQVLSSSVASALGQKLDAVECQNIRAELIETSSCSEVDQKAADGVDCSLTGCLYDVVADPSECVDLSSQYPEMKAQLLNKIEEYKKVLVPRRRPPANNRPNERNYYGPSTDSATTSKPIAFLLTLILLFKCFVML